MKKTKARYLQYMIIATAVLILAVLCFGIFTIRSAGSCQGGQRLELGEIAYGNLCHYDNTVYILEDEQYTPYLVFTSNYAGNVLLIRRELTKESIVYEDKKSHGSEGSYYPDSNVDKWLNEVFISRLTPGLQGVMPVSNVEVATLNTINRGGYIRETEFVPRKIFLLSATEMGIQSGMAAKEGSEIKGLDQFPPEGMEQYRLRTAYLWDDIQAWSYSVEGWGGEPVSLPLRLRPVFALPAELKVLERNDTTQEFVLENDV